MAKMKPGRRDLFALIMSPKRTIAATLFVVFILSVSSWIKTSFRGDILFQIYNQSGLISIDKLIVLLEKNTVRNPEFDNAD